MTGVLEDGTIVFKCILCKKACRGYGNNPDPVIKNGRCCDVCNSTKVIPARMEQLSKSEVEE